MTTLADKSLVLYIDHLYNSLIQSSIENYIQNTIKSGSELEFNVENMLKYFSNSRLIIAKIMDTISDKLNANYFCKKEDIEDFGAFRKECDDYTITPLNGRYKEAFFAWRGGGVSNSEVYEKQITWNGHNLSKIYYVYNEDNKNEDMIQLRNIQHAILYESNIKNCVMKHLSNLSKDLFNNIQKFEDICLEIVWFLSQLTLFKRGSASITEMVHASIISIVERKYNKMAALKLFKGSDLLAIFNEKDEFMYKFKQMAPLYKKSSVDVYSLSHEQLEDVRSFILTLSKKELTYILHLYYKSNNPSIFSKDYKKPCDSFNSIVNDITNSLADIL